MSREKITVGLIQQANSGNQPENRNRLSEKIAGCAHRGADLVVLQELHDSLYFCQTEDVEHFSLAEPIPGEATQFYGQIAKECQVVLVTSLFEKRAPGLYHNTAVVFDSNGSIAGKYRKMHIPDDPAYYEKFYFTPGDLGFIPVDTSLGKLGVLVCWDQWFPEAARLMAMAGAEMLIYPTAIGWESSDSPEEKNRQLNAWMTIQRSHAIANGIPVITVNRTGLEPDPSGLTGGIQFWGNSFVSGQQGELLFTASAEKEETAVVEINLAQTAKVRSWWPFFRDRRIDAYQELLLRYRDNSLEQGINS